MAINVDLIDEVRTKIQAELPAKYGHFVHEYEVAIKRPNYREAFMVLMKICKLSDWKPSESLNQLIGRFWHEVAE